MIKEHSVAGRFAQARRHAFLARNVVEGPIPAVHDVVRWRAYDLIMRLHEEFGISVSDDTISRKPVEPAAPTPRLCGAIRANGKPHDLHEVWIQLIGYTRRGCDRGGC
jgi:hypothetical protein